MTLATNIDTAVAPSPAGKFSASIASFLRPDNTTAYTALDVIASTTEVEALEFPGCTRSGAIHHVSIVNRLQTGVVTPRLYIFDAEPTNFGDGDALALVTADVPKLVGFFDFVEADKILIGTLTNYYAGTRVTAAAEYFADPVPYTNATGSLYGILQTVAGYTPIALTQWTIKLGLEHD